MDEDIIGTVLDARYRIEAKIGEGGMGVVYRARQLSTDRAVAIKMLREHPDPARWEQFQREATMIGTLKHANTVKLFDFQRASDFGQRSYLVTEFLSGRPLRDFLQPGGLPTGQVLSYLSVIADALAEAHQRGIQHRDIKPDNVFVEIVSGREQIKLLDFGIARLSSGHTTHILPRRIEGTVAYMSPEQGCGDPLDARTDVYSLGVVAFELLTGELPFSGTVPMIMMGHATLPPPAIRPLRRRLLDLPQELDALVQRMLAKRREDRPASAGAVCEALEEVRLAIGRVSRSDLMGTAQVEPNSSVSTAAPTTPDETRPSARHANETEPEHTQGFSETLIRGAAAVLGAPGVLPGLPGPLAPAPAPGGRGTLAAMGIASLGLALAIALVAYFVQHRDEPARLRVESPVGTSAPRTDPGDAMARPATDAGSAAVKAPTRKRLENETTETAEPRRRQPRPARDPSLEPGFLEE